MGAPNWCDPCGGYRPRGHKHDSRGSLAQRAENTEHGLSVLWEQLTELKDRVDELENRQDVTEVKVETNTAFIARMRAWFRRA